MKMVQRVILITSMALIVSCTYSEYLHMDYSLHHAPCWNNSHTRIALILSKSAYRPATGISRFPDGGIPKYLVKETGLFILEPDKDTLYEAVDFNDLTDLIGSSRSTWKSHLLYRDSLIYYNVSPVSDWNFYLKHKAADKDDSSRIYMLKNKYSRGFIYNVNTNKTNQIKDSLFVSSFKNNNQAEYSEVNQILSDIPLSQTGLVIKDIFPKSDQEYIREAVFLDNPSPVARRAVAEQIISGLSKKEISGILKRMDEYKESLKGNEKKKYEIHSKKLYKTLKEML